MQYEKLRGVLTPALAGVSAPSTFFAQVFKQGAQSFGF